MTGSEQETRALAPVSEGALSPFLAGALSRGEAQGAFRHAAAWVAWRGRCVGTATLGVPAGTRFDLASLTKPIVIGHRAMQGVSAGKLLLDQPIAGGFPPHVTLRALLGHRAGLPAWTDFAARFAEYTPGSEAAQAAVLAEIKALARAGEEPEGPTYSDLGYLWLGEMLGLGDRPVLGRWGGAGGRETPMLGGCAHRGEVPRGEVHDSNAWYVGGVAGHAGVFGAAEEVGEWALRLERLGRLGGHWDGIDAAVLRAFWARGEHGAGSWLLGWDSPTQPSSAGRWASEDAVGHLGFTGTSVWIDRGQELVMVLLSDRVALGPEAQPVLRRYRPWFHDAIRAELGLVGGE